MGHVWSKSRSQGQIKGKLVNTLDAAIFASAVWKFVLMISRPTSNMGPIGIKTSSLGQIEGK